MIKTKICKGDKVIIIRGAGRLHVEEATMKPGDGTPQKPKPRVCTVLKVDRTTGHALLEMPQPKQKKSDKQTPQKGVEQYKTARYNPKTGEAGGLKIVKRPIHVSNLKVVEKAPQREFGRPS